MPVAVLECDCGRDDVFSVDPNAGKPRQAQQREKREITILRTSIRHRCSRGSALTHLGQSDVLLIFQPDSSLPTCPFNRTPHSAASHPPVLSVPSQSTTILSHILSSQDQARRWCYEISHTPASSITTGYSSPQYFAD